MTHPGLRALNAWVFAFVLIMGALPRPAWALPKADIEEPMPTCDDKLIVRLTAQLSPIRVVTRAVEVDATLSRFMHVRTDCDIDLFPLQQYSWSLVSKPIQSSLSIVASSPLRVSFIPDRGGRYVLRLSVPQTTVGTISFPAASKDFPVDVDSRYAVPPKIEPEVPLVRPATQPTAFPDRASRCLGGGGVVDPQWVVARPWTSAADYVRLDGLVTESFVSRKDNPLNHESQDTEVAVEPAPWSRHLVSTTPSRPNHIAVEWERAHIPERFRPSPGDRLTAWGYWINDCGHEPYYTEIHPPVGIATQRYRAIRLGGPGQVQSPVPPGGWGQNCMVPGVITDIWFDGNSGEITSNCSDTGLHQRGYLESVPAGQSTAPRLNQLRSDPLVESAVAYDYQGRPASTGPATIIAHGKCLRSPSPIRRTFEFEIFLPRNPQLVASEFGLSAPEPPLYVAIDNPSSSGGPDPVIERRQSNGQTYLSVRVPLSSHTDRTYSRRIYAGWALASPVNWGLKSWRLTVPKLDVHDDGDGRFRGDGDWRFWIGTRNGTQEWTKIFDCDGCVTGTVTFGGRPWRTGPAAAVPSDRRLGPDVLAFPGERILVQTTGFEDDTAVSDMVAPIVDWRTQSSATFASRPPCSDSDAEIPGLVYSGCADYTMHYQIAEGDALPAPQLTAEQTQLLSGYTLGDSRPTFPFADLEIQSRLVASIPRLPRRPGGRGEIIGRRRASRAPTRESGVLTEISTANLKRKLEETVRRDPARADSFLVALTGKTQRARERFGRSEVEQDLTQLREGVPDSLWLRHFGGRFRRGDLIRAGVIDSLMMR